MRWYIWTMPTGEYDIDVNCSTSYNAFADFSVSTGNFDINCAGDNSHTRDHDGRNNSARDNSGGDNSARGYSARGYSHAGYASGHNNFDKLQCSTWYVAGYLVIHSRV